MSIENTSEIKKVMLICAKGGLDDIYPALIMANGAVMEGKEAHIFFTFFGLDAITEKKMDKIRIAAIGNPSLPIPSFLGILPGLSWLLTKAMLWKMDKLDIPPIREFLEMITDGGGKIYACKAAADMFGIKKEDLWDRVEDIITVGDFYELSAGSTVVFT